MLYRRTKFKVEIDGVSSNWEEQETGIRQGCPLSPYLFLVLMTAMFHDIRQRLAGKTMYHRIEGALFDDVIYADDTILMSKDTRDMNTVMYDDIL